LSYVPVRKYFENEETFKKYTNYGEDFLSFCSVNGVKIPNINTLKGQVVALMTSPINRNKYIDRGQLEKFIKTIKMESKDVIQTINKTDQWGLKSETVNRKFYTIPFPFVYVSIHIKKRILPKLENRDDKINYIKEYLTHNYLNIPNDKWEVGHMSPNDPNITENKLIYQPPIQGKFRDRFKYDNIGLIKYPTPQELSSNFDKYYTEDEQKTIFNLLKKRLGHP
jgi:hypothetical protein